MHKILVGGLFAALVLAMGCASAEPQSQTKVDGQFVSDGSDWDREISDEEVETFANAYIEVNAIQQQTHPEIQRADPEQRAALIEASDERVEEVIRSHGMTVEQYNSLAVRLADDDELRGRVQQEIAAREDERLRMLQDEQNAQQENEELE